RATNVGLSPLIAEAAAPDIVNRDIFGGIVDHIVIGPNTLLTLRLGFGEHKTEVESSGSGDAIYKPDGWHDNFFAEVHDFGVRRAVSVTVDRTGLKGAGEHTVSVSADARNRSMTGSIETHPIDILDDNDNTLRMIRTAQVPRLDASDTIGGFGVRDLWTPAP